MESCTEGNYVEEERRDAILSVVSFAAEHFLRNSDWAGQVPAVLARLGSVAAVSRVYIFQNHQNHHGGDTLASQRFEWVAPGTKAQLDNPDLQNLPFRAAGFARWHELLSQGELLAGNVKDFPDGERAFLEAQDVRSVMVVPVTVGGDWWGFIGFDDCNGERLWSMAEREALKAAASIFAAAIARRQSEEALQEGHRRYRRLFAEAARQAGELLLLERVRDAAQARDMKGVFRVVVEGIRETFGYHLVSLYLVQDGLLKCQHQSGYETVLTDIPLDTGIMARTVKSGVAVLVKDVAADPDFLAAIDGATSEICVPITLAGRVTGVLNVETAGGVTLGEADLRGLTSIGEQIGMVLERARESELSASIINSLPGTFYMFDKKGKMLRWNRRFEEVAGYRAEDMKRFHPLDFFPDYEKEGAAKAIERAFSAGEVSHEADILTKGGETLPFLLSGTRFDMGGETCVLGLGIDVSKRKRAKEALAASEANLRAIFEHSQDAFILIGRDLRIEAFNSVAGERAKHAFNETIKQGDSMLKLVHPQDQDAFYNASGNVLSGNKVVIEREIKPVSGEAYWAEISYNPVLDDAGQITGIVMNSRDISERKRYLAQIEYLAYHDSLTGLANRRLLHEQAERTLALAKRQGLEAALLYLDLDRFKIVNDTLGHDAGDVLLVKVATRLAASLREADTLARLGGDEFAMLLTGTDRVQAAQVAKRVLAALAGPHDLGGRSLHIGGSIGIACYPGDGASLDELLKHADIAMYQAKADGGGFAFYEASKSPYSLERLELEAALHQAVETEALTLYYQPLLNLSQNAVYDCEALARWPRASGLLAAEAFISLAEESELIRRVDWLVLQKAVVQALRWRQAGRELRVSVNLSARSLHYDDLLPYLSGLLSATGLPAERLLLEITESAAMRQPEVSRRTLAALKDLGVALAIDDFGSGFASLSYLRRLPVDRVKIDRSLVQGIGQNRKDEHLVEAAIALGHGLDLEVVAEGVETQAQLAWLKGRGCDFVQGHLVGKPGPPSSLALYSS